MAVKEFFQNLISKYIPPDVRRQEKLPFVHLFGYEKAYGKPYPGVQNYERFIMGYKSWAYACAWKNATSVAKCKVCLYKNTYDNKSEKEELTKVGKHPLLDLLKTVNPFSNEYELKTITQINLELTGNAYWWVPRGVLGIPTSIWNIPSHWMKVVPSKEKFIDGYIMKVPQIGQFIPFDESEIVHFKFPSPFDLFYGTGPLYASAYALDLNEEIKTWGINYFLNNAQPGGVLTTESSLSPDQYKRLRDQWNEKYKGTKNAGKMAFLEGGLKYQQTGSTIRDARMEFVTAEIRDEIMAIFGVPASKLGLSENVNRANADANDYTYQRETIMPRLILMEEKITEKLVSIYDDRLIAKFDSPVPQDASARAVERQINISAGYSSIDEERIKDGLDPYDLPETKVPLIPFNLTPAGQPKPATDSFGNPVVSGTDPKEDTKKTINKTRDRRWEVFVHATAAQEKLYAGVMQRYFEAQHGEVMKNIHSFKESNGAVTKDVIAYVSFNKREQDAKLKAISKPNIRQALITGIELGVKDTGEAIDFTLFDPNILRMTEARANFVAEKINASTANLLKQAFDDGIVAGESITDIAKRIDNIYNYSRDFRSKRIAQTEIIGAVNEGKLKSYDEAGVEQKEWLTAGDERVRASHIVMDGQIVDLHQSFRSGEGSLLQYPGDRTQGAPPEDTINCRCTVNSVIKL